MKKTFLAVCCLLLLFFGWLLNARPPLLEQRGMALGLFSKEPGYSYLQDLKEMKEFGVTDILLIVSWYQHDIKSNEIIPREYDGKDILTLPDEKLKEVIDQAHSLGINAVVFPILRLEERGEKDWRGVIEPTDKEAWWKDYEKFILHYAEIAARENVKMFAVGSELLSREKETDHWLALIEKVRKIYPGKLIYSANWDHYAVPEFWGSLDYIGLTAYYELTKKKQPTLAELRQKWRQIKGELLEWKKKYPDKKMIFTEIGYPSIDGGAQYPWNYFLEGAVDVEEQALCYRAFIDTWKRSKDLAGVYFWVWWGKGGGKDNSYTPRGKPAAKYLQDWYKS
ncbi:MAG: hypothetical protein U1F57_06840 [bacterium]